MDYNITDIVGGRNEALGMALQRHGFAILHLDHLSDIEQDLMSTWENVFSKSFELSNHIKAGMLKFDSYQVIL